MGVPGCKAIHALRTECHGTNLTQFDIDCQMFDVLIEANVEWCSSAGRSLPFSRGVGYGLLDPVTGCKVWGFNTWRFPVCPISGHQKGTRHAWISLGTSSGPL